MSAVNHRAQPRQAARHVAVIVDLVAAVNAKPGIGLPQQDNIVPAELALAVVEDLVDTVTSFLTIIEGSIVHEQKGLNVGAPVPLDALARINSQVERVAQCIAHPVQFGGLCFAAPYVRRKVVLQVARKRRKALRFEWLHLSYHS